MRQFRFSRLLIVLAALPATSVWADLPRFEEVKAKLSSSEYRVFDRDGAVIQEQRENLKLRQTGWVTLDEVSPALKEAVLASEDRKFSDHHGVDWLALAVASGQYLVGSSKRGASTISMQVASLLDQSLKPKNFHRVWRQKFHQVIEAVQLEKKWSKPQILEAYLNLVFFRGELKGIGSASHGLFGKAASGLNRDESFILAALIRSPQAEEQKVEERACALAKELNTPAACVSIREIIQENHLIPHSFDSPIALAPQAARILLKQNKTHSTLDHRLQQRVTNILRRQVISLRDRRMGDAAALVVENKTGKVLAYVGNIGDLSSAQDVDGVQAFRQAGSTLKPFLYSLAIENHYLTASSEIDDSVVNISLGEGAVYRPRDFDNEYHGDHITVRSALGSSLNVPAVRTLGLVGVGSFVNRLNELGFQKLRSEEFYGPSLALGTADVSLWELVNAYRTLANEGLASEMTLAPSATHFRRVISSDASFIVSDILSDRASRTLTFGMDTPMSSRFWSAAKTGTSKDMRDNWCIGFSRRYTVGVWSGNFSGEPMHDVSGVSGAAPAWSEIMDVLQNSSRVPKPPAGVKRVQNEWYIRGTEPTRVLTAGSRPHGAKIVYPVDGLMIARDPDIPADLQRVFFEAKASDSSFKWTLNDRELGRADSHYSWKPEVPGSYELKLVSSSGEVVDQVHFTVKR